MRLNKHAVFGVQDGIASFIRQAEYILVIILNITYPNHNCGLAISLDLLFMQNEFPLDNTRAIPCWRALANGSMPLLMLNTYPIGNTFIVTE